MNEFEDEVKELKSENLFKKIIKYFATPFFIIFSIIFFVNSQNVKVFALKGQILTEKEDHKRVFFIQAIDSLGRLPLKIEEFKVSSGSVRKLDKTLIIELKRGDSRSKVELETKKGKVEIPIRFHEEEKELPEKLWLGANKPFEILSGEKFKKGKFSGKLKAHLIFNRKAKMPTSGEVLALMR